MHTKKQRDQNGFIHKQIILWSGSFSESKTSRISSVACRGISGVNQSEIIALYFILLLLLFYRMRRERTAFICKPNNKDTIKRYSYSQLNHNLINSGNLYRYPALVLFKCGGHYQCQLFAVCTRPKETWKLSSVFSVHIGFSLQSSCTSLLLLVGVL